MFKKIARDNLVKYPESVANARKDCLEEFAPEIIVKKDINLLKDKSFLGFYFRGKIPKYIKKILIRDYSDKIWFDGKKIRTVKDISK